MPKSLTPNQFDYAGIYVEGTRSSFRFRKPVLSSFMSGMLVPLGDPIPVMPGAKFDLQIDATIRSNTMLIPPLDSLFVDFFAVWVPHRIVWNHFAQFLGENDTTAWTQSTSYIYPHCNFHSDITYYIRTNVINNTGIQGDVVAANNFLSPHYGLATKTTITSGMPAYNQEINILAYRGYYFAWNHLFRDENYQRPVLFDKGDTGNTGEFGYLVRDYEAKSGTTVSSLTGVSVGTGLGISYAVLMPVNKFHDAFTSGLPQPQFSATGVNMFSFGADAPLVVKSNTMNPIGVNSTLKLFFGSNNVAKTGILGQEAGNGVYLEGDTSWQGTDRITHTNLVADLSNATATTINQLRTSIMYQRYLEALARGGRRVPEYYDSIYGVKNTAAAKDYPELLSRSRYYLGVQQVVATADGSGSGWTSKLGDTGAFSLTVLRNIPVCEKDFTEFGYLHILYCVRAENRYSQLIQPHFLNSQLLDEYNPYFDHIGDTAVPNHIVNFTANSASNFFYNEAWWQERTQLGMAVGAMNKEYGSLSYWTAGEVFNGTLVTCTPAYLCFNPATLDDFFVSRYYSYPQFIMDANIRGKKVVRMSAHSIPGIVGRI